MIRVITFFIVKRENLDKVTQSIPGAVLLTKIGLAKSNTRIVLTYVCTSTKRARIINGVTYAGTYAHRLIMDNNPRHCAIGDCVRSGPFFR